MEGISDIRICGMDEERPPKALKKPYIDLVFQLSHEAPKGWCETFNRLVAKREYKVAIDPEVGLFIETWVRRNDEIEKALNSLKTAVELCNAEFISELRAKAGLKEDTGPVVVVSEEQVALDKLIKSLNFDD